MAGKHTRRAVLTIPVFAWELSLAFWLIVKGFNESVMAEPPTVATGRPALVESRP